MPYFRVILALPLSKVYNWLVCACLELGQGSDNLADTVGEREKPLILLPSFPSLQTTYIYAIKLKHAFKNLYKYTQTFLF